MKEIDQWVTRTVFDLGTDGNISITFRHYFKKAGAPHYQGLRLPFQSSSISTNFHYFSRSINNPTANQGHRDFRLKKRAACQFEQIAIQDDQIR